MQRAPSRARYWRTVRFGGSHSCPGFLGNKPPKGPLAGQVTVAHMTQARTPGRAWTCRIVSFWSATRQPRQNSNRSADTPTPCAASDSSGGGGLEEACATRHGEGDAATHQGDAGPEVSAGDDQSQVSLSDVWLSHVSAVASERRPDPPTAAVSTEASPAQAASRKGRWRRLHGTEWRVRLDRLSRGRGMGPKAGSGKDLATRSKHARATGQRGGMPPAPRYSSSAI